MIGYRNARKHTWRIPGGEDALTGQIGQIGDALNSIREAKPKTKSVQRLNGGNFLHTQKIASNSGQGKGDVIGAKWNFAGNRGRSQVQLGNEGTTVIDRRYNCNRTER